MKIVIPTSGDSLDSPVDERFGRAANLLIYDTETGQYQIYDNSHNQRTVQGAGIQAAQTALRFQPDWVLTGHCGPKAFLILSAGGVRVGVGVKGTIAEAIERLGRGEIVAAEQADVEGHWV